MHLVALVAGEIHQQNGERITTLLAASQVSNAGTDGGNVFVGARSYRATGSHDGAGSGQRSWPVDRQPPSSDGSSTSALRRKGSAHECRW